MLLSAITTSILVLSLSNVNGEAPPGYVNTKGPTDKNPPKYEYGYNIQDEKGASHGKLETRDGIYALGRYYVQGTDSSQNVQYYADDWGYHPFIEYSNVGPHSRTKTQLLLGVEAVKALASNKFTSNSVPAQQHVTDIINSKISSRDGKQTGQVVVDQPQQVVVEQRTQQTITQQPQQIIVQQQPQQVIIEQQPQQILIEQPQPQQAVVEHRPQVVVEEQQQQVIQQPQHQQVVVEQQQHHQQVVVTHQPQLVVQQPQHQQVFVQQQHQPQVVVQQPQHQQVLVEQQHQPQVVVQQPQHQQVIVEQQHQPQVVVQQLQHQQVHVEQQQQHQQVVQQPPQQQVVIENQPQQQQILGQQQIFEQSQQPQSDNSDSITVEARNQQSEQNLPEQLFQKEITQHLFQEQRSGRPQVEHVLSEQEISYKQSQNIQPQVEQIQIREGISHQQQPQLQLRIQQLPPQPQRLVQENKQIQQNEIEISQQTLQLKSSEILSDSQRLQSNFGGFGSRADLLDRRPNVNLKIQQNPDKLIETTRNLISGQDVLNINDAIDTSIETNIESSTERTVLEKSSSKLFQEPIVVADFNDKIISSTEKLSENIFSTTANSVETLSTKSFAVTEPSSLLVTPRPVSTNFLAPVTAGIQLSNVDVTNQIQSPDCNTKTSVQDSQSSKKIESVSQNENYVVQIQKSLPYYLGKYEFVPSAVGSVEHTSNKENEDESLQQKFLENIELSKTLLALPGDNSQQNKQQFSQLTRQQLPEVSIKENFVDADQQQAQHQLTVQQVNTPVVIEKVIEKQVPVPVIQTKIVEKPVEVTKYVKAPYPVEVPVHIPVEVPVEKRIPVPITVEKIVEKPVKVTEIVEKRIHVPQPYPVEKIVEKPVPVEVTKYVDRPYPVPVQKNLPQFVSRPYALQLQVPLPVAQVYTLQAFPLANLKLSQPPQKFSISQQGQKVKQSGFLLGSPDLTSSHSQNVQVQQNNGYLPPGHNCDQHSGYSSKNLYYTIPPDDYIGLLPPRLQDSGTQKFRSARSNFNSNLRLEYGFMPPLRPSQEIDEHGNPITREKP